MENILVIGSGNKVEGLSNFAAINCHDQEFNSDNEGQTIFNNGSVVIKEDEVTMSLPIIQSGSSQIKTLSFTVDKSIKNYFISTAGGTVDVTLTGDGVERTFTKINASANTVVLYPHTGTINGAATYSFNTQYQRVTPLFDGTNWYV